MRNRMQLLRLFVALVLLMRPVRTGAHEIAMALATDPVPDPTTDSTVHPTAAPSAEPSAEPSAKPSPHPSAEPTAEPTSEPTVVPSTRPSPPPSALPSPPPSALPSRAPSNRPTSRPTAKPTTSRPTTSPTPQPSSLPSPQPTPDPTAAPTADPTPEPSGEPTPSPTSEPTESPSVSPTPKPTPKHTEAAKVEAASSGDLGSQVQGLGLPMQAGIAAGVLVVVICATYYFFFRKKKNDGDEEEDEEDKEGEDGNGKNGADLEMNAPRRGRGEENEANLEMYNPALQAQTQQEWEAQAYAQAQAQQAQLDALQDQQYQQQLQQYQQQQQQYQEQQQQYQQQQQQYQEQQQQQQYQEQQNQSQVAPSFTELFDQRQKQLLELQWQNETQLVQRRESTRRLSLQPRASFAQGTDPSKAYDEIHYEYQLALRKYDDLLRMRASGPELLELEALVVDLKNQLDVLDQKKARLEFYNQQLAELKAESQGAHHRASVSLGATAEALQELEERKRRQEEELARLHAEREALEKDVTDELTRQRVRARALNAQHQRNEELLEARRSSNYPRPSTVHRNSDVSDLGTPELDHDHADAGALLQRLSASTGQRQLPATQMHNVALKQSSHALPVRQSTVLHWRPAPEAEQALVMAGAVSPLHADQSAHSKRASIQTFLAKAGPQPSPPSRLSPVHKGAHH